ncbi:unnamed protein product [Amaranthus hypochondriacus]
MGKYVELMIVVVISMMSMTVIMGSSEKIFVDEILGNNNNILLVNGIVKCIPNGGTCYTTQDCCAGNRCKSMSTISLIGFCQWCPTAGYPCGMLDPCCSGLTCDGYFSGTCR